MANYSEAQVIRNLKELLGEAAGMISGVAGFYRGKDPETYAQAISHLMLTAERCAKASGVELREIPFEELPNGK